jgi:hypothetical protein
MSRSSDVQALGATQGGSARKVPAPHSISSAVNLLGRDASQRHSDTMGNRRLLIIAAALLAMVALAADIVARAKSPGHEFASAIAQGYRSARTPDADAAEDEGITGSAEDAGYRWAERQDLANSAACPTYSPEFHRGCAAYVEDQAARAR